jgi:lipopolysaccharide/colanic/teichoic acid biosynthesis glycosyltransferase
MKIEQRTIITPKNKPISSEKLGGDFAGSIDYLIAAAIFIFVLPLLVVLCVLILLSDGGPVFFKHRRIGRNGTPFYCLKLRSMAVNAEARLAKLLADDAQAREDWARDHKLKQDPRITKFGLFLRRSSLDELPQLINILRGEMSLVGPRPIVDAEVGRYGWRIRHYCSVKPGLTGLWQVSGRNDVSYRTRVAMDCLYARKKSTLMDIRLLVATIPAVLNRKGSY